MTDARKKTQSEKEGTFAVVYVNGTPTWDFHADYVAYVLGMGASADRVPIMVPVLRQHTDPVEKRGFRLENASALRRSVAGLKFRGDNLQLGEPNEGPYRDFVDEHFEFLYGTSTDDRAVHGKYLDERPYLKGRIFREGVQGISYEDVEEELPEEDAEESSVPIFDIMAGETDREIQVYQTLFSMERKRPETVEMTHTLREVRELDYQKYRKATTRQLNARARKLKSVEDYNLLSSIYDGLVKSVSNAVIDGVPCSEDNKKEWAELVPLEHKLLVLTIAMREVEGKNVS
jgi:hypothetical protein